MTLNKFKSLLNTIFSTMNEQYFLLHIESFYGKGNGLQPVGVFRSVEAAKAFAQNWEQTFYTSRLKNVHGFKVWFSITPYKIGDAFGGCLHTSVFQNFTAQELNDAVDSVKRP
jgi:hypothetical protein